MSSNSEAVERIDIQTEWRRVCSAMAGGVPMRDSSRGHGFPSQTSRHDRRRKSYMLEFSGASSNNFMREMMELIIVFRPVFVILLEPKLSGTGADEVCRRP